LHCMKVRRHAMRRATTQKYLPGLLHSHGIRMKLAECLIKQCRKFAV